MSGDSLPRQLSASRATTSALLQAEHDAARSRCRLSLLAAGLLIALYAVLALVHISMPGLQYDEALFMNAALGKKGEDPFIHSRLFGIPFMLMPYLGALKSYLFYPIFRLFGVSYLTIRGPCVLLSAITLWLWFRLISRLTSDRWGILFLLLAATNPGFVIQTRLDYGPVVLMLLLEICALTLLLCLTEKAGLALLGAFLTTLFLGIFDKLNFLWFVVAIVPGSAVFAPSLWHSFRSKRVHAAAMIATAALLLAGIIVWCVLPILGVYGKSLPVSWGERFTRALSVCDGSFSGTTIVLWVTHLPLRPSLFPTVPMAVILALSVLLSVGAVARLLMGWNPIDRPADLWTVSLTVQLWGVLLQVCQTAQATGPHHVMVLLLLGLGSVIVGMATLARWLGRAAPYGRVLSGSVTAAAFAGSLTVTLLQTSTDLRAFRLLTQPEALAPAWSTQITALAEYIEATAGPYDSILCTDWGLGTQIHGFCRSRPTRRKIRDVWNVFAVPLTSEIQSAVYNRFLSGKRVLVVTHGPHCVLMNGTRDHLMQIITNATVKARRLKEIPHLKDGTPLFEVYEVLPARAASTSAAL